LNIVVCVKQVFDPEAPARSFGVDAAGQTIVVARGVSKMIGAYDESAVEAGLQIRDQHGGKVTLVSLGPPSAAQFLKETMAFGADEAILLADEATDRGDSFSAGHALARAIGKIGAFDIILCGREGSDTDAGIVGPCIAEDLSLPCATLARRVEVGSGGSLRVERAVEDGFQVVELTPPAVVTVTSECYQIRYPTMATIIAADEKDVTVWSMADIRSQHEENSASEPATTLVKLFVPVRETACQLFEADTLDQAAADLVGTLRSKGLT